MSADLNAPEIQIPYLGGSTAIERELNGKYRAKVSSTATCAQALARSLR
ncbi:hypothetical protein CBM2623_U60015 [Cupriavidus taiwanensis]|nr:hypothetical protein CBM2608_U80015 [Cupriavidus taiwanensis]SPA38483.1 hypothetical protein CBM2623_U60015 [Cupriavidus taiwanensis]